MIDHFINTLESVFMYSANEIWGFTMLPFWIFFTVVVGIYSFVYKHVRRRNIYLLIISLFFYYKTGGWFYTLLVFSCISNYLWGLIIGKSKRKSLQLIGLISGIVVNLMLLVYFKYAFFFTDLLNKSFGDLFEPYNWLAHWWNMVTKSTINTNDIILPIGISFFTFQAISYIVDVYRNKTQYVSNIFDFSFYLSFFPQLVAGPIVRASGFIPQLYRVYKISKQEFGHAIFLILVGLSKKIILSDYLAVNFIDRVFDQPMSYSGVENLMSVYAYALQIYGDFSGYTDIAIGLALLLGFKLPINFNSPYKASSLNDFWHRWHISLSTWLRDYLYIPLGGNRKGKLRTYINLFLTMVLGGLWHGANMRFISWGSLHGIGLIIEKIVDSFKIRLPQNFATKSIKVFITFHFICLGWLFFRADSLDMVWMTMNKIYFSFKLNQLYEFLVAYPLVCAIIVGGFIVHGMPSKWSEFTRGKFIQIPIYLKLSIIVVVLFILNLFIQSDIQPFIYFRF